MESESWGGMKRTNEGEEVTLEGIRSVQREEGIY